MGQDVDVAVVIPTHNRSTLLPRAIDSVLSQTHPVAEVIVVDDHSTDDTPQVVASYGAAVRGIRTPANVERGAARNIGARSAGTAYVSFLDSDDEWRPEKLEAQLDHLRAGHASVTGVEFVDQRGRVLGRKCPGDVAVKRLLLENQLLGAASSLVLSRAVFGSVDGYPEERSVQGSEDWLFLVKLVSAGCHIDVAPAPLVCHRVHGDSSTENPDNVARSMWAAVEWLESNGFTSGSGARAARVKTAGVVARGYAANGRWSDAATWLLKAWRQGHGLEAALATLRAGGSAGRGALRRRMAVSARFTREQ
jgi:glycosyltransferase involved in cell wall biosynthesis